MSGWIYIMTNRRDGVLYVGVTSDLASRIWQHRTGAVDGFTRRYGLKRLIYAEPHESIVLAIAREKVIKKWTRARKVRLIEMANPKWDDLYDQLQ